MPRALVIDDEQLVLESLEAFLVASMPDLSLDKTSDIETAMRLSSSVRYQLVLLDWNLTDASGMEIQAQCVIEHLRSAGSSAPIIVVSGDDREDWPQMLLELGLSGFVPKSSPGATLLDAIQVALRGGMFLPQSTLKRRVRQAYRRSETQPPPQDLRERFPSLTERQVEVFERMIRGSGDKQIARELGISESTVKTHVHAILAALGVNRRGKAVFQATGWPGLE